MLLGTIFLQHTDSLLGCYTLYCVGYDEATLCLVKLLKKRSEFRKWHDKVKKIISLFSYFFF